MPLGLRPRCIYCTEYVYKKQLCATHYEREKTLNDVGLTMMGWDSSIGCRDCGSPSHANCLDKDIV